MDPLIVFASEQVAASTLREAKLVYLVNGGGQYQKCPEQANMELSYVIGALLYRMEYSIMSSDKVNILFLNDFSALEASFKL